ncbi:MAG: phosphate ABC transporter permease subunit PstC, partial [Acidimicrobiaceae bacterium]|nr:phosphate ABC transporter permease subunit PstC [Acidimicrobiaceae bacterium]
MTVTETAPEATTPPPPSAPPPGPSGHRRFRGSGEFTPTDNVIRAVLLVAALLPTLALAFLAYQMIRSAYPAIVFTGGDFFTTKGFSVGTGGYNATIIHRHGYTASGGASFGLLTLLFGTVVSSLIALIVAVPVAVGGAILLVEKLPRRLESIFGVFLELLAGIPSVVYGLWGYLTLAPLLARHIYVPISHLGIPWFTKQASTGQGLLTSSLVLALMVIPIIASTTRELVRSVPVLTKEGAVGLGLTNSESVRLVTLPFIRSGVVAATFLGWGRALGETLAVLMISGNFTNTFPNSIFAPFSTMAATIARLLDAALGDPTGMS